MIDNVSFNYTFWVLGKSVNLMSIKDFYNAVTPGSTITHGTGLTSEAFSQVTDSDIHSDKLYQKEEIPVPNSILNKVRRTRFNIYLQKF